MMKANPIFEKHYEDYLRQLNDVDVSVFVPILDIAVNGAGETVAIPFFETIYRVSRFVVVDEHDKRPDYGICVILLKHLLMCP